MGATAASSPRPLRPPPPKLRVCTATSLLLAAAVSHLAPAAALNASIIHGVLLAAPPGRLAEAVVGGLASSLNIAIGALFPTPAGLSPGSRTLLINSSHLNYLTLTGSYRLDEPLALPPRFVLVLRNATLRVAANFSGPALILANATRYAAVVAPGGPRDALVSCLDAAGGRSLPSPTGVWASSADSFTLDGVTVEGCGHDDESALVAIRGAPFVNGGEVVNCELRHGFRAVWTLASSRAVVRRNAVFNCSKHSLDADAFSRNTVLLDNAVANCTQEGVFVEQGAQDVAVVRNALGPGLLAGVSVYNFEFAVPASGCVIAGNAVSGARRGVSVGSTARTGGAVAEDAWVVGNTLTNNLDGGVVVNGRAGGITVAGNRDGDGLRLFASSDAAALSASANLSAFDAMGRLRLWRGSGAPAAPTAAPGIRNATVAGGVLTSPGAPSVPVGGLVSALNAALRTLFGAAPWAPVREPIPVHNASLSFVTLSGDFAVDEPLVLRAWTVFVLRNATLRIAANFAGGALIFANGSRFAAVVAPSGPRDALVSCLDAAGGRSLPSPTGVWAASADAFLLSGVTVEGCGGADGTALVALTGGGDLDGSATVGGEVSDCDLRAGGGAGVLLAGVYRPLVRGNSISACAGVGVDVGNGTTRVLVTENAVSASGGAGMLVRRGARVATLALNTLGPSNEVGISMYAPTASGGAGASTVGGAHAIVANNVTGNRGVGVWVASAVSSAVTTTTGYAFDSQFAGNALGGNAQADVAVEGGAWGRQHLLVGGASWVLVLGKDGGGALVVDVADRARLVTPPTPTATVTTSSTATRSLTATPTRTATSTMTSSPTGTPSASVMASDSLSGSPTGTTSSSATTSTSATSSPTGPPTLSASPSGASTLSGTPSTSAAPTGSRSPSGTPPLSGSQTGSPSSSATASKSLSGSQTGSPSAVATGSSSGAASGTNSPSGASTPSPSGSAAFSPSASRAVAASSSRAALASSASRSASRTRTRTRTRSQSRSRSRTKKRKLA